MAAPKPNYTCRLSLLAATTSEDIRQFLFGFSAIIGEIITDISYLCEPGVSKLKWTVFLLFLSF